MFNRILYTLYRILRSPKFFVGILVILVLEAAWFAITAQYPMAFDENYHLGIIKVYSHQWLPFITTTPSGTSAFGDITRYDSYMYHYLMSFPYRFFALFIHNEAGQIIALRFVNIAIFTTGVALFHRLLRRIHIPAALNNFSFLMFILIPVVPFLAATINYDNLTFLMVPVVAGLALTCARALRSEATLPARSFILLLVAGGMGSLVKYAFLPIFMATLLYLLIVFIRTKGKKGILHSFVSSFRSLSPLIKVIVIVSFVIAGGLVTERYGVNIVKYHSIEPDCSKVQTLDSCLQYGPWARNYNNKQKALQTYVAYDPPVVLFVPVWLGGMMLRLFFAINYTYANADPLPVPITVAAIIASLGAILVLIFRRTILKIDRDLLLLGAIILLYVASLFYVNVTEFLRFHKPTAVNGRYLLLVMPFIFAWIGLAYLRFFQFLFRSQTKKFLTTFSVVILLLMLQGGGDITYLVQSSASWYWQDTTLIHTNETLQKLVKPVIIGGRN